MELEVPAQITYSSTHAQLSLLSVDDGTEEPLKGIATSVSTPAFISFRPVSTSITISVTGPDGATVEHKRAGGTLLDEDEDETDYDDGYARVPELGYFSSCSSIDSLATLASHEDLATLASATPLVPVPITLLVPPPVPGPTADGLDDGVGGEFAPQQAQRFLRFQETQLARYSELFDDGVNDDAFDFFGYGAYFRDDLESETEIAVEEGDDTEAVRLELENNDDAEAGRWVAQVPFLIPIINIPATDDRDHEAHVETKVTAAEADMDADKENHSPLEIVHIGGVQQEEQTVDLAVKDAKQLSTPDGFLKVNSALDSCTNLDHDYGHNLKFTLDGELDFGFDFGTVLDEVMLSSSVSTTWTAIPEPLRSRAANAVANKTIISEAGAATTPTVLSTPTPNFTFTAALTPVYTRGLVDESPYSSPSVYSTESAPHSPYPFATPSPRQQQHSEAWAHAQSTTTTTAAASALVTNPDLSLASASVPASDAPTGVFGAYDPACFDGLGFESMDLKMCADASVQVVFDAGEDDGSDEVDTEKDGGADVKVLDVVKEDGKERQMVGEKEEREEHGPRVGDDSFSLFEVERQKMDAKIQDHYQTKHNMCTNINVEKVVPLAYEAQETTPVTEAEEAFVKWRQACLALAAFAHIPVKAAVIASASGSNRCKGKETVVKDDVFVLGFTGTIQVFAATELDITGPTEATTGAAHAAEDNGIGSEVVLNGAVDAATPSASQLKIEPVLVPCSPRNGDVLATGASSTAENGPEDDIPTEEDENDEVCPPTDDIVSYIYSIPGPECMPSFAAVIAEHLSPAPAPLITPASSFAIPATSTSDDCLLLSEPAPAAVHSSSFSSLLALCERQFLGERSMSIDDFDHMPSLLAEESPFDGLVDTSIPSLSTSSSRLAEMVVPDSINGSVLSASETEPATEALPNESKSTLETESPAAADLSNGPLDTILEVPEDAMDEECAELIKILAELEPDDFGSDYDVDIGDATSFARAAPSPLLAVCEELAGGPQHLLSSLPRYARRSLDSLTQPWRTSLSSLSSLGRRSLVGGWNEEGQAAGGSEVAPSESSFTPSGTAPAAASEDGGWSLVASPQPESPPLQTPLRPLAGSVSATATPSTTSTPAMQKKPRAGFFMSRLSFCPSPSPKRTAAPPSLSPTRRPRPRSRSPTPLYRTAQPVEKLPAAALPVRSGGRIRAVLWKLRTLF